MVDDNYLALFKFLHDRTPGAEPIQVFSTNYDTILENQLRSWRFTDAGFVPDLCTGFEPGNSSRWQPSLFDTSAPPGKRRVNLYKLHGSVTWKRDPSSGLIVEMDDFLAPTDYDCLLYFGYKSVPEDEPFRTLHQYLKGALLHCNAVIAIGFRFVDPYIRETFDFAMRANPNLRILCCLKYLPEPDSPLGQMQRDFSKQVTFLTNGTDPVCFGKQEFMECLGKALED